MSRSQILFYATASDLVTLLSALESQKDLQYTLTGHFEANTLQTYRSHAELPNLGMASHPTAISNPSYLVSLRGTAIRTREVPQKLGGIRFAVDQRLNEDTIVFRPGGLCGNDVLLYGMVGTVSNTPTSKTLYNFVAKQFREHFEKVREFLIGPEALDLCRAGIRLTSAVSTPPELDLKL
jgi:hypothetical protein